MPNDYVELDVPTGNGVGAATSFVNRSTRTVMITGTWAGLVTVEGTADDVTWFPLPESSFKVASWKTYDQPLSGMRIRRSAIAVNATPGTPAVWVGGTAEILPSDVLPAPVGLNGPGAGVSIAGYLVQSVTVAGPFNNAGMLVYIEISMDNVCWSPILPAFSQTGSRPVLVTGQYLRQRIIGRTVAGAAPTVTFSGESADVCFAELAFPAINGAGVATDTSGCGPFKSIVCGAPGGDVPGMISVEGSNDGGNTFVRLTGFNTTGFRQVNALAQFMRVNVSGLSAAVAGLCVGVSSVEEPCETPSEGASTMAIAGVGGVAVRETTLTLNTPAGVADGDLLVAAFAITYAPSLGTSPVAPGAVAVITPAVPANWELVLADFPGGNNAMGNQGAGLEADRFAVYKRVVTAAEAAAPIAHTFTWAAGGGAVSSAGVIKAFATTVPTFAPSVYGATAVTITANGGNPMNVTAPTMTPTEADQLLVTFYVARNGLNPAPGGSTFSTPAGMANLSTPVNMRSGGLSDPIGIASFVETVSPLPTGVRVSVVTQDNVPSNPFRGMGYSILVSGCTAIPGPAPAPPG